MKKQVCFVALLSLLFTGVSHRADAQFWKKIFGSRDKREKKSQPKSRITPKDKPVTPVKKKKEVKYPSTAIKQRYRVDVFVHMYLDELVKDGKPVFKNKIPEKAVALIIISICTYMMLQIH
jgi:hypothetical protein